MSSIFPNNIVGSKTIKTNVFLYPDIYYESEIQKAIDNNECIYLFVFEKNQAEDAQLITDLPQPGLVYKGIRYKLHGNIQNISKIKFNKNNKKKQENYEPPLFFLPKINQLCEETNKTTNIGIQTSSKITFFLLSYIFKEKNMSVTYKAQTIPNAFIDYCNWILTASIEKQNLFFVDKQFFFFAHTSCHQTKINILKTKEEKTKREKFFTIIVNNKKNNKYPLLELNNFSFVFNKETKDAFSNLLFYKNVEENNIVKKIIKILDPYCYNEYTYKKTKNFIMQ
jgi:hypothetical protein